LNLSFTSNQAVVARNVFNALAAAESQSWSCRFLHLDDRLCRQLCCLLWRSVKLNVDCNLPSSEVLVGC
jgi:hypothetical protein